MSVQNSVFEIAFNLKVDENAMKLCFVAMIRYEMKKSK